jgi:excisionase family DNA binding protein
VDAEQLLVTVAKAAAMTDVGRSTGYQLVASGEWPSVKVGRSIRVPVAALRAWLEGRMRATTMPSAVDAGENAYR